MLSLWRERERRIKFGLRSLENICILIFVYLVWLYYKKRHTRVLHSRQVDSLGCCYLNGNQFVCRDLPVSGKLTLLAWVFVYLFGSLSISSQLDMLNLMIDSKM